MEFLGDSLSENKNIEHLSGSSPEDLKTQLRQIKLPYRIVSIYSQGGAHIAWIIPTLPIKKVSKNTVKEK